MAESSFGSREGFFRAALSIRPDLDSHVEDGK